MAGIAPQPDDETQAPPAQGADSSSDPNAQADPNAQGGDSSEGGPDELSDEEGRQPNVTPEEQAQYQDFVTAGLAIIYKDKQVRPAILSLLDNDPSDLQKILNAQELQHFSPLVAIAATTVVVVLQIQRATKGTPDEPSDDVAIHGAAAILEELAEIWMRANKQQLGEDDVHKALSMAADIYREVAADEGLVDDNALKQEFMGLVRADRAGKLAQVSPELAGIDKAAQINADQPDDQPDGDGDNDQQAPDNDGDEQENPQ